MSTEEEPRIRFGATVERPDGVTIEAYVSAPADRPDVGELGELAQMGAWRTAQIVAHNLERAAARAEQEPPF